MIILQIVKHTTRYVNIPQKLAIDSEVLLN